LVKELFDPSRNRLGTLFQTKCDLTRTGEVRMLRKSETPVGEHVGAEGVRRVVILFNKLFKSKDHGMIIIESNYYGR